GTGAADLPGHRPVELRVAAVPDHGQEGPARRRGDGAPGAADLVEEQVGLLPQALPLPGGAPAGPDQVRQQLPVREPAPVEDVGDRGAPAPHLPGQALLGRLPRPQTQLPQPFGEVQLRLGKRSGRCGHANLTEHGTADGGVFHCLLFPASVTPFRPFPPLPPLFTARCRKNGHSTSLPFIIEAPRNERRPECSTVQPSKKRSTNRGTAAPPAPNPTTRGRCPRRPTGSGGGGPARTLQEQTPVSALPTRPPEAPRRPSPAWLLIVLAAGLAPTALGADPLVVLTVVTTAASLIPKGADT